MARRPSKPPVIVEPTRSSDSDRKVAVIANKFIQHARYRLTSNEQRFVLYLATLVKPTDTDFHTYLISARKIKEIINPDGTKNGAFYSRLDKFLDNLTDKKISFPTDFRVDGQQLRGYINWVASAIPVKNERGELNIRCALSVELRPFLIGLNQRFTQIDFIEVAHMTSGHSIRIFQMCKAYLLENERHGRDTLQLEIKELKERLGIANKYKVFRDFKRRVLDKAVEEINEKTRWKISYEALRRGTRSYTHVQFKIEKPTPQAKLSKGKQHELTWAQNIAVNALMDAGVDRDTAAGQMILPLKQRELHGYEDYFVTQVLDWMKQSTDLQPGTEDFVAQLKKCWLEEKRFRSGTPLLRSLVAEVVDRQMKLAASDPTAFANRFQAASMPEAEFKEKYRS